MSRVRPHYPRTLGTPTRDPTFAACRFAPRCTRADERCVRESPPAAVLGLDHVAHCHHPLKTGEA